MLNRLTKRKSRNKKQNLFSIISLGCPKNLVDSERFLGLVNKYDYVHTTDIKNASLILINTCGFIADATEESINTILQTAQLKRKKLKHLIVTGCLVKRYKAELILDLPEVDLWIDLKDFTAFESWLAKTAVESVSFQRSLLTPAHYAYLRISDGCDNRCSYCAIPDIRGAHKSETIEKLISEAKYLSTIGVQELIITAQDTTLYGVDKYGKPKLIQLLQQIESLNLFPWIRLLYLHPAHLTESMIDELAKLKALLPYFDIPLQHISDEILIAMNRKVDSQTILRRLTYLKQVFPDCAIRTTFITGFPGEKISHFKQLKDFITNFRFTRLGVFCYSCEENTPASLLEPQVSKATAEKRKDTLMSIQQSISSEVLSNFIGSELDVIVESKSDYISGYEGRSFLDSPEIDGKVYIYGSDLPIGQIVKVRIAESLMYDLIGEVLPDFD
jgi:ribosomal protein S12 methylthiotransferase